MQQDGLQRGWGWGAGPVHLGGGGAGRSQGAPCVFKQQACLALM